jgi:hypothetical protein
MGIFLGFVLGYPQWRVLRGVVHGAWLWLPANCAAWALGMPAVFAAIDFAQWRGTAPFVPLRAGCRAPPLGGGLAIMMAGLLFTGALVGAVHGLALVRLASQAQVRLARR